MADEFCVTTVDLLRHGKPEGGDIFRGTTDVALSEQGWQQMHAALAPLSGWQQLVSSPMLRCQDFASALAIEKNMPMQIEPGLSEISFGDWEGRTFSDVAVQDKALFEGFWTDPFINTPTNGEPLLTFCQRIRQAFWQSLKPLEGQHVLMVVHGGVIRAILQDILQSENIALMRYEVPYASISRIKIYHDDKGDFPQLVFHNR